MNEPARIISPFSTVSVRRWEQSHFVERDESIAEEIPVALVYNGLPHVVMMATPGDLEDFALGFSMTEGVLRDRSELHAVAAMPADEGIEVRMDIDLMRYLPLEEQRRNLAGRTGCGLCGAETFAQAIRHPAPVTGDMRIRAESIETAFAALATRQGLNAQTGAVHGAAWVDAQGAIHCVREDVGRHNALDKTVGAVLSSGDDLTLGFAVITSRASFEMVQKAATVGVSLLAAISAPTALAIRLAREMGVTLIGFSRAGRFNVYTHPQRVLA